MLIRLIILSILFSILFSSPAFANRTCSLSETEDTLEGLVTLGAVEKIPEGLKFSAWKYPEFKEGSIAFIQQFAIFNEAGNRNCTTVPINLTVYALKPSGKKHYITQITVPSLPPELNHNQYIINWQGSPYYYDNYIDSEGKNKTLHGVELDEVGPNWTMIFENPSGTSIYVGAIIARQVIGRVQFTVGNKDAYQALEYQQQTVKLMAKSERQGNISLLVTALIGVVSILGTMVGIFIEKNLANKYIRKQEELTNAQLRKQEELERRKKKELVKVLIQELKSNLVVIEELFKKEKLLTLAYPAVYWYDFNTYAIEKVLSEHIIEDDELSGNLYGLNTGLKANNNYLVNTRMVKNYGHNEELQELNKTIIENAKGLKVSIESAISKLKQLFNM